MVFGAIAHEWSGCKPDNSGSSADKDRTETKFASSSIERECKINDFLSAFYGTADFRLFKRDRGF